MMTKTLSRDWSVRPESSYGLPVYVCTRCGHGGEAAHSLEDAIACGLLVSVRAARRTSRMALAETLGVHYTAVARWERGERRPIGLSLKALRRWLLS